ncbi:MAG: CRISPR-associated protein Cas2 [Tepidanaerobacteraceae bacterium]|nr:CRISPR-associated protein Cas2 [Tepidanaerobacteraceae bacterium]
MYVIIVYDVEQARVAKVCKYLRRYLHWVQNSAFEGEITEAQLEKLKSGLKKIVDPDCDSIYIYRLPQERYLHKEVIGQKKANLEQFLD